MSEQSIVLRFQQDYPEFTGTLENSSDTTILLLKILAESESIGNNYYDYYLSEEYNMDSYLATKLFNYNIKLNIPYKYDIQATLKIKNSSDSPRRTQLPKYTLFESKDSTYLLENSLMINSYNSTESLTLIQGQLNTETINSQSIISNSSRYYKLSISDYIYPDVGYLEIDDIRYSNYSIIDSKYSDSQICYGVELSDDGNYYLILSKKLFDKIMINSKITLSFLVKDIENDGESFTELTTDPVLINDQEYEISITQITINSKIRDQLKSTTLLDFDTNISKFDYEENINSLEPVILAKTYDCSDLISNSIIELNPDDPSSWDVKLIFEEYNKNTKKFEYLKDEFDNYIPVPYYMYVVVASLDINIESVMSLQLKREIMNSIQNGLCVKEVLMDYGTLSRTNDWEQYTYQVSIQNQGYQLSPTYRPYQLPYIVNAQNVLQPINYGSEVSDSFSSRYNMPDLVIQLEPASYIPVDITLKLELSYDSLDDLMNFYLSLIDSIKTLFELSKSNEYLKFNSKLTKSDIDKVVYQYPEVNFAIIDDFIYYRNHVKSEAVPEIQFAPFELPVLGKLTIYLDVTWKIPENDKFLALDRSLDIPKLQQGLNDRLAARDSGERILFTLSDSLKVKDSNMEFDPIKISSSDYQLGITYWIVAVEGDQDYANITTSGKSIITTLKEYNNSVDDDPKFSDDNKTYESGLFTDEPSPLRNYINE